MRRSGARCDWVVERTTDYLEGALARAARTALERHLDSCDGCAAYLSQIRSTIRVTALLRL